MVAIRLSSAGELSLMVADFNQSPDIASLTQTNLNTIFNRLLNFLAKSLDRKWRNSLEETDPGFGLADLIATRWPGVSKVQLILISNRLLSSAVKGQRLRNRRRNAGHLQRLGHRSLVPARDFTPGPRRDRDRS